MPNGLPSLSLSGPAHEGTITVAGTGAVTQVSGADEVVCYAAVSAQSLLHLTFVLRFKSHLLLIIFCEAGDLSSPNPVLPLELYKTKEEFQSIVIQYTVAISIVPTLDTHPAN